MPKSEEQEEQYQTAVRKLSSFHLNKYRHIQWLRMSTMDAAERIPNDSADFIYFDGTTHHDYCSTMEDLEAYWPKLRVGGIMGGRDFLTNAQVKQVWPQEDWGRCSNGHRNEGAVAGAVLDFVKRKVPAVDQVFVSEDDAPRLSWYLQRSE